MLFIALAPIKSISYSNLGGFLYETDILSSLLLLCI